jgi:hypothetical protein
MKRKVEICVDNLSEQFAKCCTDHDNDNDIDDLIDKLSNSSIENDIDTDIDEFEELKDVCNKTNGTGSECKKIIDATNKRYNRYLDGITNWMGFEELRDDIYKYLKMNYKNSEEITVKMKFMRKIDKIFLVIAKEARESEDGFDSRQIKKIKKQVDLK